MSHGRAILFGGEVDEKVDDKPIEMPRSRWEWLLADKRRLAALVAVVVVVLGGLVALALGVFGSRGAGEGGRPSITPLPPLASGEETVAPEGSLEPTGSAESTQGTGPGPGAGAGEESGDSTDAPPVVPGRAPFVAYRFGEQVWVSREDGSDAVMVADSSQGEFALAPDGTALALVDGGVLSLITVSDLKRDEIGAAEPAGFAWSADSSSVLFVRAAQGGHGATDVWRASRRTGSVPLKVVQGSAPALAIDGTIVALPVAAMAPDPAKGTLWVLPSGRNARQVATSGLPAAATVQGGLVAYAVTGMRYTDISGAEKQIDPEVWVMRTDGTSARRLVGKPATARPFGYANLMLSPDGQRLLYAEVGDDGYSRAWVVAVAEGAPVALTVRRDTYPLGWSADGQRVFFIEGNAFQGEPTALVTAGADGGGRRTVIEGAGL